jgi:hypothetical protein
LCARWCANTSDWPSLQQAETGRLGTLGWGGKQGQGQEQRRREERSFGSCAACQHLRAPATRQPTKALQPWAHLKLGSGACPPRSASDITRHLFLTQMRRQQGQAPAEKLRRRAYCGWSAPKLRR